MKFKSTADLAPNKARYEAFMKEFGKQKQDEVTAYSQKNYPAMREITGAAGSRTRGSSFAAGRGSFRRTP